MQDYIKLNKYHIAIRVLHWLMALMVIALLIVGFYMADLDPKLSPIKFKLYGLHESFGVLVLVLLLIRMTYRATTVIPGNVPEVPAWNYFLAKVIHLLLYTFLIIQPIAGICMSQLGGYDVDFFGTHLPKILEKSDQYKGFFHELHTVIGWSLVVAIGLHILGAFKHLLVDKKNIFVKIW